MNRTRVAIFGAGELGQQLAHHLHAHFGACVDVLGFIDDTRPAGQEVTPGLRTLGGLAGPDLPADAQLLFAIGYSDMRRRRAALDRALASGRALYTLVHPRAIVEPGAVLGPGCVVLAAAVVDQGVRLGAGCHLDIGVRLTNATQVGHNNWFSSGTSTGSRVDIGDDCFFGMDCTVTTDVRLGSGLYVNAKSLVAHDVADNIRFVQRHQTRELPLA